MMPSSFLLISFLLLLLGSFRHALAQECPASGTCLGVDSVNDGICQNYYGSDLEKCVCGNLGMCEWVCDDQRWDESSLETCPPSLVCPEDGTCSSSGGGKGHMKRCNAATTLEDCLCASDTCEWACDDTVWVDGSLPDLTCGGGGGKGRGLRA